MIDQTRAGLPEQVVQVGKSPVPVLTRKFLDEQCTGDSQAIVTDCGELLLAAYIKETGLVVLFCAGCEHAFGAIRVAPDA